MKLIDITIRIKDKLTLLNVLCNFESSYSITFIANVVEKMSSNLIENIHTTFDEASEMEINESENNKYSQHKLASEYVNDVFVRDDIIRVKDLIHINNLLIGKEIGIRKMPIQVKDSNGNVVHNGIDANNISIELSKFLAIINKNITHSFDDFKELVLSHHKFESIHPFYDGNGRAGRILLNYVLRRWDLLHNSFVPYSYAFNLHKDQYYEALSKADNGEYDSYMIIMCELIEKSIDITTSFASELKISYENILNNTFDFTEKNDVVAKILKIVFSYIKSNNSLISNSLGINNKTVTKYINIFANKGIIELVRRGKYVYYKNLVIEKLLNKHFPL